MTEHIKPTVNIVELLTTEQKELNEWSRISLQIYFAWYSVFLTVNGAGLAWLSKVEAPDKVVAKMVFLIFAFFNLLGIGASAAVFQYVGRTNARVTEIYERLLGRSDGKLMPRSPMASQVARAAVMLDIAAMTALMLAWGWLWHSNK